MKDEEQKQILKEISGELKDYMEDLREMNEEGIPGVVSSLETEVSPGQYEEREFPAFYQLEGVKEILDNKRMLIADEMGVGKTAQAVAAKPAIEDKENQKIKSLVISRGNVESHWAREINRYLTDEQKIVRMDNYDEKDFFESKNSDFTIIKYDAFGQCEDKDKLTNFFIESDFNYLILDETHNVKNPRALRTGRIKTISDNTEYLCMLSGTPIPDKLKDTFNLIAMLEPDKYEDADDVRKRHWDDPRTIRNVLNRKRISRKLDDVADVPPIQTNLDGDGGTIELTGEQRELYDSVLKNDSLEGPKKLRELRYALLDPKLVDPNVVPNSDVRSKLDEISSTKYERLDEIVEEVSDRDEKVVVYSPHRVADVTEKLEERYEGYGSLRIDGSVNPLEKRTEKVKEFKEDEDKHVLIATPATAGEGISLVEASNVVFLDESYSPGERKQLLSRVRRRGQNKPVDVKSLSVKDSIDEGILELLDKKQKAIDFVENGKKLSSEDRELLRKGGGRPVRERMYTPQQKIRIYSSRMFGKGHNRIRNFLERNDGKNGKDYAENFVEDWENSYSANTARVYGAILQDILEGEPDNPVDLGSGPGILSHLTGWQTTNVDINKFMFDQEMASSENKNIVEPIHNLPFDDEMFDLAVCSLSLNYTSNDDEGITEREESIREANRILGDGGTYIITLPWSSMSSENDMLFREGLSDGGFEVLPDYSGFVRDKNETDFGVYVCTAEKIESPTEENFDDKLEMEKVNKNPEENRLHGLSSEFEFVDREK